MTTVNKKRHLALLIVIGLLFSVAFRQSHALFNAMRPVDIVSVLACGVLIGVWLTILLRVLLARDSS